MTKKDFELIARVIKDCGYPHNAQGMQGDYARDFADALAETNPRFDRARFLKACGAIIE